MKLSILITIICIFAISSGCSKSDIVVKPNATTNSNQEFVSDFEPNRQITSDYNLTFPIGENPGLLQQHHRATMVGHLQHDISDYRMVTGFFPESILGFIESGFPLFWHRNQMTGLPMEILISRDVKIGPSDFGVVKWEKFDDYHARLISSNMDLSKYEDNGKVSWIIEEDALEFFHLADYQSLPYEELDSFMRENSLYSLESATTIVGGTAPINMVSDPEVRKLYAQCGLLTDFIFTTTLNYYARNNKIPNNFIDNLAFQQDLGSTPFIIKENLEKLALKLNEADVEFKVGYDFPNTASYALLKINGETMISHCYKYDFSSHQYNENVNPLLMDESPGIHVGIYMDEVDMSSPMISDSNLSTLNIPEQFILSIEDIPIE